jgi:pimeloyl-ACP methyl ester carboxylesterase
VSMEKQANINPFALFEAPRALLEMSSLALALPILNQMPRGDSHGVFVIPGFGASDSSTFLLRQFLDSKGYQTSGWQLGRNLGLKRLGGMPELLAPFLEFQQQHQHQISIIGWSLGGVHARRIARACPKLVRQVICLGSPIHGFPIDTPVWTVYERVDGTVMDNEELTSVADISIPSKTPSTAIYSKSDGVVPWQIAMEQQSEHTDNVQVFGSHIGLGVNPSVFYIIADRLSQTADAWQKFNADTRKHRTALGILDPIGRMIQAGLFGTKE